MLPVQNHRYDFTRWGNVWRCTLNLSWENFLSLPERIYTIPTQSHSLYYMYKVILVYYLGINLHSTVNTQCQSTSK